MKKTMVTVNRRRFGATGIPPVIAGGESRTGGFRKKYLVVNPFFLLLLTLVFLAGANTYAQDSRINGVLIGRVINLSGDPVAGAKVKAEYFGAENDLSVANQKNPLSIREVFSDKNGKWSMLNVASGIWRVSAEHNQQSSSSIIRYQPPGRQSDLGAGLDQARMDLILRAAPLEVFLEARRAVYRSEWEKVLELLTLTLKESAAQDVMDEIFYWKAYSIFKIAIKTKNPSSAKEKFHTALEALDQLITIKNQGLWADDARILMLELWYYLVKAGEEKYLEKIRDMETSDDLQLKISALDVHYCLEPKKALPLLKTLALENPDPGVRKKALLIISREQNKDTYEILAQAAEKDKDLSVRNRAQLLLEK